MADNVEIQGIEFQIVGNASKANQGLKALTSTLKKLQGITSKSLGLTAVANDVRQFNEAVGEMDTTGITSMADAIRTIGGSSRMLSTVRGHLQAISDMDFSRLTQAANIIGTITANVSRTNPITTLTHAAAPVTGDIPAETATATGSTQTVEQSSAVAKEFLNVEKAAKKAKMATADFLIKNSSEADLLKMKLQGVKEELQKSLSPDSKASSTQIANLVSQAQTLQKKISEIGSKSPSIFQRIKKSALSVKQALDKWWIRMPLKALASPFKSIGSGLKKAAGSAKKFVSSLGRITMYRAIRFIFSSITTALKEGINNLNAYSKTMGTTFHQSLNTIATDALYLKNSLAAAVAPIINALAPAIDFLADKVAHLLNLLAQLFARLSGKSTYTKAVKSATEYGNAVGGAAEKAKNFTAGFDELNVFDPNSGGGGGGGLGDVSNMFEEATIDDEISSFADRLKELFKSGSWAELGTFIGEKFNEVVDSVSWDNLGKKIGNGFNGAIQTAYGFMKTTDFENIGNSFANILNNAIENIDFETVGRSIIRGYTAVVDTIGGLLGDLNWKSLGDSVGNLFKGAFSEASDWLASVDWGQLGSKLYSSLKDVVEGIDLGGIAKSFFKAFGSALGAAVSLIGTFCADAWTDIKEYFSKKIEECGGDIPAGLWKGITDGLGNIVKWITENIFDPFVEGFKNCFGIHSPSTVMEELGGYVVEGFFNGVEKFTQFLNKMEEWANAVVEWFRKGKDGKGLTENFKELATNIVTSFKDKVGTTYHTVKTKVTTWASNVKTWFTGSSYGGVNSSTFSTYASNIISGFTNGISNLYTTCKDTIEGWGSNITKWFKGVLGINSPSKVFYQMADFSIQGFNRGFDALGKSTKGVVDTWANSFTNITPTMGFAVDTSALKYYDSASFSKGISTNVNSNHNFTAVGFMEAMQEFYHEYMEPTLLQMAEDMRRQADKPEQPIVQIGNRTINDAVTTQQKANGYKFTTA